MMFRRAASAIRASAAAYCRLPEHSATAERHCSRRCRHYHVSILPPFHCFSLIFSMLLAAAIISLFAIDFHYA